MFEKPFSADSEEPKKINRREFLKRAGALAMVSVSGPVYSDPEAEPQIEDSEPTESYETQFEHWEKLGAILESPQLQETLKTLDETYKGTGSDVIFRAFWDNQAHESLQMIEAEMHSKGKTILDSQVGIQLLAEISEAYTWFWSQEALLERIRQDEVEHGLIASFSGFEQMSFADGQTLTNEEIQTLIEEHFTDKRWLYENIGTFRYSDKPLHAETFQVAGTAEERSITNTLVPGKEQEVVIHQYNAPYEKHEFLRLVAHEVAHHHDWIGSLRLPLNERLELLREVTELFQTPDRLSDTYVDKVIPADSAEVDGKHVAEAILYRQVAEYWAVINEQYDTYANFADVYPGETELIEKWRSKLVGEPE